MKILIIPNMVTKQVCQDYERIFQIPLGNPKMDDDRRTIHEEDNEDAGTSSQAFLVKAGGLPLGNHFHNKKIEVFFVLEGLVERLTTEDATAKQEFYNCIPAGAMIVVPPGIAHTFLLSPGSRMLCYSSERFDPGDMVAKKLA